MQVIDSKIDTNSAEYKANYEHMEKLVTDLNAELDKAANERSERAINRAKELSKLPVRKRLELLLDRNTPFLEIAPLAARNQYDKKVHGAGMVVGIGTIMGRECLISGNDFMIKGGTVYPIGVKKSLRAQEIAMENRLPMINLVDSGGAFLPLQSEIFPDKDDGGRTFYNQALMSKMGVHQITGVFGLCTAGGAYVPAMSDDVVHVNKSGAIFLGGPPLVRAATGEVVTADELGGADLHCRESGVSDYFAEDDEHAIQIMRDIIGNLPPANKVDLGQRQPKPPLYDPQEMWGVVPPKLSTPYDVPRGHRPHGRRQRVPGVQGAVRGHSGLRLGLYPRLPGGHPGQQRRFVQRKLPKGHPVYPTLRPPGHPADLFAKHQRLHHRP